MVRRIHTIDEMRPNVFEALKRAYIKRGVVPPQPKLDPKPSEPPAQAAAKKPESESPSKPKEEKSSSKATSPEDEQEKSSPKNPQSEQTLHEVAANTDDKLFEASTVFPFTLVPDTLTLDREKLTIANRIFWKTANITSTPVSEIMSCEANVGPIFGSIHLTFRFFTDNQREIKYLWREDAMRFQRLMHGYIIANRKEVDVSKIKKSELIELLLKLGTGASD
jgi:hypothetical protein